MSPVAEALTAGPDDIPDASSGIQDCTKVPTTAGGPGTASEGNALIAEYRWVCSEAEYHNKPFIVEAGLTTAGMLEV